jgi:hypothetical protein
MKAGFGRRDITPHRSMNMAGFDRRKDPSTGTLDELEVQVLALADDREVPFLMCIFDLLGTDSTLCTQVRESISVHLEIPPERIWVGATHTHSAPTGHFSGNASYNKDYVNHLATQAVAAAAEALADLKPAAATGAMAQATGVASLRNRGREGSGFPMPLPLIFPGEHILARISCHPTVLDEKNLLYSRDLPGQLRDGVKKNCLVLNGPCADLSTRFTRRGSNPEELQRLGQLLTEAVQTAIPQEMPHFGKEIRTAEQVIYLSRSASLSGELRESILAALRQKMADCTDPQAKREYDSRIAVLERSAVGAEKNRMIRIGAVNFGSYILVGVPFEVDYADGLELEQTLSRTAGQPVFLICYSFGYDGYLPSGAPLSAESSYEDIASRYLPESRAQVWECAKQCVMNVM